MPKEITEPSVHTGESAYRRKDGNRDPGLLSKHGFAVAVISAILGSTGGPFILVKLGVNPYRADPVTGTEVKLLDARVETLEKHVGPEHPDRRGGYDARITANAMQIVAINTQLGTINTTMIKIDNKIDVLVERLVSSKN